MLADDMDKATDDQSCRGITEPQNYVTVRLQQVSGKWGE